MLSNLSYRTIRALHICTVFTASIFIEQQLNMPRGAWTGFTVILIYAGFDVGSSILRIWHRFWGVLFGLLIGHIFWLMGHLDYRTLLIIAPCVLGTYYYLLGKPYVQGTVFTTMLSMLGSDYFANSTDTYHLQWFFRDYFMCTLLAAVICLFFEYFIFFRTNMTRKFYTDFQQDLISEIERFLNFMHQQKIKRGAFLDYVVVFNTKMVTLNTFTTNTKNDYHNKDNLITELTAFTQYANTIYHNIRKMYILHPHEHFTLLTETHILLEKIKQLISKEKTET